MKILNFLKRKKKLETKNEELKYYCQKCSKELSFEMYQAKKCFWCDAKSKPVIVKEIDHTPKNIKGLNAILINSNWNHINKYNQRKEVNINGINRKKEKSAKKSV